MSGKRFARNVSWFPRLAALRRVAFGALRVALLFTFLTTLAVFFWVKSAKAKVSEALAGFGRELAALQGTTLHSNPRLLTVNGVALHVVSASSTLEMSELMNRLEALCRANAGVNVPPGIPGNLRALNDATPVGGILRKESDNEGLIACLDPGQRLDLDELVVRLKRFSETGNLGDVGELRYARVERNAKGATVLVLWTEGDVPLRGMFPQTGDAPGKDPKDVPRPEGSRRFLSGAEHGAPYSATFYEGGRLAEKELFDWYVTKLRDAGFRVTPDPKARALTAERDGRVVVIRTSRTARGKTMTSVAELS